MMDQLARQYLEVFDSRERVFHAADEAVDCINDSGGFRLVEINYFSPGEKCAELIAGLLNMVAEHAKKLP